MTDSNPNVPIAKCPDKECGGECEVRYRLTPKDRPYFVKCLNKECGYQGPFRVSELEAILAHNRIAEACADVGYRTKRIIDSNTFLGYKITDLTTERNDLRAKAFNLETRRVALHIQRDKYREAMQKIKREISDMTAGRLAEIADEALREIDNPSKEEIDWASAGLLIAELREKVTTLQERINTLVEAMPEPSILRIFADNYSVLAWDKIEFTHNTANACLFNKMADKIEATQNIESEEDDE